MGLAKALKARKTNPNVGYLWIPVKLNFGLLWSRRNPRLSSCYTVVDVSCWDGAICGEVGEEFSLVDVAT